ncbi:MAG: HEPN domain-containing protein [Rhodospirillaceae bacterium]|nr:HEPN domain-containing protein [Rhodospirillaceae bacterium]
MSDAKCARMLVEAAERDIEALRVMRRLDGIPDEIYGFHVQQAAEKLLKAGIALLGGMYPLTHNIEALLELFAERDGDTEPFGDLAAFTPYAVEFRYVGVGPDDGPIDRATALEMVEGLLEQVRQQLLEGEGA